MQGSFNQTKATPPKRSYTCNQWNIKMVKFNQVICILKVRWILFSKMASFKIELRLPDGTKHFECPDDEYVLEAAEQAGIDMSYSCRAGACSTCVGKIIQGTIDQSDQSFLDDDQMENGYTLLCVAYATSDLVVKTDCEDELW